MAGPGGLEPPTHGLEIRCSIRLSYGPPATLVYTVDKTSRNDNAKGAETLVNCGDK